MFIIHVTPLVKSGLDKLSYFSSQEIPVGSIVHVPLRNKEVPALVLEREDARAIKSILRTNLYETKKIKKQHPIFVFSAEFIRAAQNTATFFATSTGSIIHAYVPTAILNAAESGTLVEPTAIEKPETNFEQLVLQIPRNDRIEKYKAVIRSHFAQGKSVFLCAPTIREARFFKQQYERGIEQYTFLLESSQTPKKQYETWNAILSEKHPVLIIATPTYASIPRSDIAMFILEHEISSSYKQQMRPNADARVLITNIAFETNSTVTYAGTTVSLNVYKELHSGRIHELEEHARKLRSGGRIDIIDSKKVRAHAKEKKGDFPTLSPHALEALTQTHDKGEHSFVFAARRGIASHTICNDCDTTVTCTHCASPMVLHEHRNARELLCHRCGSARDAHETCVLCGSWNLVPLGIGIERIESYLRTHIPTAALYTLSSDTAQTPTQAKKIIREFYATPGSILVGTEMALSYIQEKVTASVMSSIDSLLCVPDFQIEEKIFGIIATLREHTTDTVLIETTNADNLMLKHAQSGSIEEYAREELSLRKKLHYPPFTILIQVSVSGSREKIIRDVQKFVDITKAYKPRVFGGFIPLQRGSELRVLIRVPAENWPDAKLVTLLKALPPSFTIDINPQRTL